MADDRSEARGATDSGDFAALAKRAGQEGEGPLREFWYFLNRTRKWWMAPVILALLLVGFILLTGGTALAPLIYTVF